MELANKKCLPCHGGVPRLSQAEYEPLLKDLPGWKIEADKKLVKSYKFKDFAKPMALANKIAEVAEAENHHPDLIVRWGELRIELFTHAIDGLSENDFILAAKIDRLTA